MPTIMRPEHLSLKTPSVRMEGQPCRACRHLLPTTEAWHLVGPWSPPSLRTDTEQGNLNRCDCPHCGAIGLFVVPARIFIPERLRSIIVTGEIPIPIWNSIEDELSRLCRESPEITEEWLRLPIQRVNHQSEIPSVLKVPDEMVWLEEDARRNRIARLALPPRLRSRLLVDQVLAQADRQKVLGAKQILNENSVGLSAESTEGQLLEFGVLVVYTADETTRAGRAAIEREINKRALSSDSANAQLLEYFRSQLHETGVSEFPPLRRREQKKREKRFGIRKIFRIMSNVRKMNDEKLQIILGYLANSSRREFALDICEARFYKMSPPHLSGFDRQCITIFGALCQQSAISSLRHLVVHYLSIIIDNYYVQPQTNGGGDPDFLVAYAMEHLANHYQELGRLPEALNLFVHAARAYRSLGRLDGTANCCNLGLVLASTLGDQRAEGILLEVLESLPEKLKQFPAFNRRQAATFVHENSVNVSSDKVKILTATWTFLSGNNKTNGDDDLGDEHTTKMVLTPLNYDPDRPEDLPDDASANLEVINPFTPAAWRRFLRLPPENMPAEIIIGRVVKKLVDDKFVVVQEEVLRHPLLGWVGNATSSHVALDRWNTIKIELWHWAATSGHGVWLAQQWEHLQKNYSSTLDAWPNSDRAGIGLAFARVATVKTDRETDGERERWFGDQAIVLLDGFLPRDNEDTPPNFGTSPHMLVDGRSMLARCLERVGRLEEAIAYYEANFRYCFSGRQVAVQDRQRLELQRMVGLDNTRLVRALCRLHGVPPEAAVCVRVSEIIEMTRSRQLFDRLLNVKPLVGRADLPYIQPEAMRVDRHSHMETNSSMLGSAGRYMSLLLLLDHDTYIGGWLICRRENEKQIKLQLTHYDEPHDIVTGIAEFYNKLERSTINDEDIRTLMGFFHRAQEWFVQTIYMTVSSSKIENFIAISPYSYLLMFPWAFVGLMEFSLEAREVTELTKPSIVVVEAFSEATASLAESKRLAPTNRKISLFLNPMGDLPEVNQFLDNSREFFGRDGDHLLCESRDRASASRFLVAAEESDILVFLGHGIRQLASDTSNLLFSFGGTISGQDISEIAVDNRKTARIAIILACWGATFDIENAIISGESEGLPYAFRGIGYDYIITSLWPLSPRFAMLFLHEFLINVDQSGSVRQAFASALYNVVRQLGLTVATVEGGGLQLMA